MKIDTKILEIECASDENLCIQTKQSVETNPINTPARGVLWANSIHLPVTDKTKIIIVPQEDKTPFQSDNGGVGDREETKAERKLVPERQVITSEINPIEPVSKQIYSNLNNAENLKEEIDEMLQRKPKQSILRVGSLLKHKNDSLMSFRESNASVRPVKKRLSFADDQGQNLEHVEEMDEWHYKYEDVYWETPTRCCGLC